MYFKMRLLYPLSLLVLLSCISSSAVERIDFYTGEFSVNDIVKAQNCANIAIEKAGISERITNEPFNEGGFGKVFYTPNYAVKISSAEYHFGLNNAESTRLINVKNQLRENPPSGVNFCLPEHVYKVYVDGNDCAGFNIQVMPRIRAQGTMSDIAIRSIRNSNVQDIELMRCFGEKMGKFHSWGLVQNPGNIPDRTCMHGDFNSANILVTNRNAEGGSADFIFVDNGEYSNPQVTAGGGGSLVSDLTRFNYFCAGGAIRNSIHNWKYGQNEILKSIYKGYIPQLPKEVCQKLMLNLYDHPQECLAQTNRDNKHSTDRTNSLLVNAMLDIQSQAFQEAYRAIYSPEDMSRLTVVNSPRNAVVAKSTSNKAQHKQLARQQKTEKRAAVKAQKAQQKQLARQQKSAVKAQKTAQKIAVRSQKAVQRALKAAAKRRKN